MRNSKTDNVLPTFRQLQGAQGKCPQLVHSHVDQRQVDEITEHVWCQFFDLVVISHDLNAEMKKRP